MHSARTKIHHQGKDHLTDYYKTQQNSYLIDSEKEKKRPHIPHSISVPEKMTDINRYAAIYLRHPLRSLNLEHLYDHIQKTHTKKQ